VRVEATYDGKTFQGVGPSKSIAKVSKLIIVEATGTYIGRTFQGVGPTKSIAKVGKLIIVEATYNGRTNLLQRLVIY
jgi:hypothetical protein